MKLHLGCGNSRMEGWVGCDLYKTGATDLTFDLMGPWPFEDNVAEEVYCSHVLEHLPDPMHFFRELWRVCQPNATVVIRVPHGASNAAWWDLTHLRPWFAENFCMLQPGYGASIGNHQHDEWYAFFGVHVSLRLAGKFARKLRHRWFRWLVWPYVSNLWGVVEEIHATLYALKTPDAVEEYQKNHLGNTCPAAYVAWQHQLRGDVHLKQGEAAKLVTLHDGYVVNGWY